MRNTGSHKTCTHDNDFNFTVAVHFPSLLLDLSPTTFRKVPTPSTEASTTSPGFKNRPVAIPTPAGDPVNRTSPQAKLDLSCTKVISSATVQVISDVLRSEEHTSELQSRPHLVCRLLLEKKK